ncbi:hypothetical protein [Vogesella oryzae]|uniref:hypothetical protein n=1 Tax=Vogesella oryzae TaxID=1735285 RepID=UPI001583AACB|nr:hypothetical protein [Vogesella oryzae]
MPKIRRDNLHQLVSQHGGVVALAHRIDRDASQISRYLATTGKSHRHIGNKMAAHIERSLSLPAGWLSTPHHLSLPQHPLVNAACQYLNTSPDPKVADIIAALLQALTPPR